MDKQKILKRLSSIETMANALLKEAELLKLELGSNNSPSVKRKKKDNVKELFAKSQAKFLNSITIIKKEVD